MCLLQFLILPLCFDRLRPRSDHIDQSRFVDITSSVAQRVHSRLGVDKIQTSPVVKVIDRGGGVHKKDKKIGMTVRSGAGGCRFLAAFSMMQPFLTTDLPLTILPSNKALGWTIARLRYCAAIDYTSHRLKSLGFEAIESSLASSFCNNLSLNHSTAVSRIVSGSKGIDVVVVAVISAVALSTVSLIRLHGKRLIKRKGRGQIERC